MNFAEEWQITITKLLDERKISPELKPLIQVAYDAIKTDNPSLADVRSALEQIMVFLSTPAGRTHANCMAVDVFFSFSVSLTWEHLPSDFQTILDGIGSNVHATVSDPKFAASRNCLPEQLLARLRALAV